MLVSKSNGFNASAVLGSGSYNENKSSKHMELLAHSILKLICQRLHQRRIAVLLNFTKNDV